MRVEQRTSEGVITAYTDLEVIRGIVMIQRLPKSAYIMGRCGDKPIKGTVVEIITQLQSILYEEVLSEGFEGLDLVNEEED